MTKIKLSKTQATAMYVLKNGGRIFSWNDCTVGMEDGEGNTLAFRKTTFNFLIRHDFIEISERPSLQCQIYSIASHFEF